MNTEPSQRRASSPGRNARIAIAIAVVVLGMLLFHYASRWWAEAEDRQPSEPQTEVSVN